MQDISEVKSDLPQIFFEKFCGENFFTWSPICIENQAIEVETCYSKILQTRVLRIGPLIFVEIPGDLFKEDFIEGPALASRIQKIKIKLGTFYRQYEKHILFTRPSKYSDSEVRRGQLPLDPHTILPIAVLISNKKLLLGKCGIDFGCGDGILSRVALKCGAQQMILIDWNDLQLEKARAFLNEETPHNSNTPTLLRMNIGDKNSLANLKMQLPHQNFYFSLSNIAQEDSYQMARQSILNALREYPQIKFYFDGGYDSDSLKHQEMFFRTKNQLLNAGFCVEKIKYFYMNSSNNRATDPLTENTISVAGLIAKK